MADRSHLDRLKEGVEGWNRWRREHPEIQPDLSDANLINASLSRAYLDGADLSRADLSKAELSHASLHKANLESATLILADCLGADLNGARLAGASLFGAFLFGTRLKGAHLRGANLLGATLMGADLSGADLSGAHLMGVNFHEANLTGANLSRANLTAASLIGTRIDRAVFEECRVHGIAAWNLIGKPGAEKRLIVTAKGDLEITVNRLDSAQFCNLLLSEEMATRFLGDQPPRVILVLAKRRRGEPSVAGVIEKALAERSLLVISVELTQVTWAELHRSIRVLARNSRVICVDLDSGPGMSGLVAGMGQALPHSLIQPLSQRPHGLGAGGNVREVCVYEGQQDLEKKFTDQILPGLGLEGSGRERAGKTRRV